MTISDERCDEIRERVLGTRLSVGTSRVDHDALIRAGYAAGAAEAQPGNCVGCGKVQSAHYCLECAEIAPGFKVVRDAQPVAADAERVARRFHSTYEFLSAQYGYTTRKDTREFDPESPNGKLMIATCAAILRDEDMPNITASQPGAVPRIPTVDMLDAGRSVWQPTNIDRSEMADLWLAMYDAAPAQDRQEAQAVAWAHYTDGLMDVLTDSPIVDGVPLYAAPREAQQPAKPLADRQTTLGPEIEAALASVPRSELYDQQEYKPIAYLGCIVPGCREPALANSERCKKHQQDGRNRNAAAIKELADARDHIATLTRELATAREIHMDDGARRKLMHKDKVDAAILAATAEWYANKPGPPLPQERAIWDAACEACAKACESQPPMPTGVDMYGHPVTYEDWRYADACRAQKSEP